MEILIADDSKPIRMMLRALLEGEGHGVVEAADGAVALGVLEGPNPPSLAILDWAMPSLDGPEICARLRSSQTNQRTYLILLTAKIGRAEILSGLRCGANDYVTKPFDEEALLARVQIGGQMISLQHSLASRITELEKANQELDAFSRMVAHDLRSPLGAVAGFIDLLEADHAANLNPEGRMYLAQAKNSAEQMNQTIVDLLNLARATRGTLVSAAVDLATLAREWIASQEQQTATPNVEFVCPPVVPAHGDAGLLRLVMQNLLSNAWKFSRCATTPRVELKSSDCEGSMVYSLSDNGAGFDMAHACKLFKPFQRLHRQHDFEGTGIGLTIAQRIVERHGGRIWAKASEGQGATFHFTLSPAPGENTSDPTSPAVAA